MKYNKGDVKYSLDFWKLSEGKIKILEIEITWTDTATPDNKDQAPFQVYTYISNWEVGKIAVDFADVKLKDSEEELKEEIRQDCNDYIEKCNKQIENCKESIKLNKSILKQVK